MIRIRRKFRRACHRRLQERTPAVAKTESRRVELCRNDGQAISTLTWYNCLRSPRYHRCVKTTIGIDGSRLRFQERQESTIVPAILQGHPRPPSRPKQPKSPWCVDLPRASAPRRFKSRFPRASLRSVQQQRLAQDPQRHQSHQRHRQHPHHHQRQRQRQQQQQKQKQKQKQK